MKIVNSSNSAEIRLSNDLQVLESFIDDNAHLERLEAILDQFNPFVAVGWVRQELRHSAFLRWILDPSETHGLNDYFLNKFLMNMAKSCAGLHPDVPTIFEVESWNFNRTQVQSEWENIDIIIADDDDRFVVAIENKVETSEHSGQLQRYREFVERHFPTYKKMFAYLTVAGEAPSDSAYASMNYQELADLIALCVDRREDQMSLEVRTFVSHYVEMVRRNIVENSEIQTICDQIYEKHKRALDILFEHRPDRTMEVKSILEQMVRERDDLIVDHCTKSYVRFIPTELDYLPKSGTGQWTNSMRMLLFEFENYNNKVLMKLILGPGESDVRSSIYESLSNNPKIFNRAKQKLYPKYWSSHAETWVNTKQYSSMSLEELRNLIGTHFERFLEQKLPKMISVLARIDVS